MLSSRDYAFEREHPLLIVAMDHRDSLAKQVYGIEASPSSEDVVRISAGKMEVLQSVVTAAKGLPPTGRPGVLVDERYGSDVARAAKDEGFTLLMPIERSGEKLFHLEYGRFGSNEWLDHLISFNPDFAKALVRDSFSFSEEERRSQQDHLAYVTERLQEIGIPLVIELLVPDTGDAPQADFDAAIRPELTVRLIRDFHDHGVEPDVWKLEGYETYADATEVANAAREGDRSSVTCIILGRDAPQARLDRWLQTAAPVDGFTGFAIGRSIWEQPLLDHLNGRTDLTKMSRRIGDAYAHYADVYTRASGLAGN